MCSYLWTTSMKSQQQQNLASLLHITCSIEILNVVRRSMTNSAAPGLPLFCSYHILNSSVICFWTDSQQHESCLSNCWSLCYRERTILAKTNTYEFYFNTSNEETRKKLARKKLYFGHLNFSGYNFLFHWFWTWWSNIYLIHVIGYYSQISEEQSPPG